MAISTGGKGHVADIGRTLRVVTHQGQASPAESGQGTDRRGGSMCLGQDRPGGKAVRARVRRPPVRPGALLPGRHVAAAVQARGVDLPGRVPGGLRQSPANHLWPGLYGGAEPAAGSCQTTCRYLCEHRRSRRGERFSQGGCRSGGSGSGTCERAHTGD